MYQVGDRVVYGIHGICRVAALEDRTVDKKRLTYLALEPEGQQSDRYYVPTHNEVAMSKLRSILGESELRDMLVSDSIRCDVWIKEENLRKQRYRELINCADPYKVLQMVFTLYRHKIAQTAAGRKVHQCDENFLRDAEKLLASEIASVMGITLEEAKSYLRESLK